MSKKPSKSDLLGPLVDKPAKASKGKRSAPEPEVRKVRATYYLSADIAYQARDAATALMGPPTFLTLAAIVERGVAAEVERLKKIHNKGKRFPERAAELKGGRRPSR